MVQSGIYRITSPSGRIYVGQSKNIKQRWVSYRYCYDSHANSLVHRSISKYGYENHTFVVLEECPVEQLSEREVFWIAHYKCNSARFPENRGMNVTDGGEQPPVRQPGYVLSEEARKSISEKAKKRHAEGRHPYRKRKLAVEKVVEIREKKPPKEKLTSEQLSILREQVAKNRKPHSEETKAKMSAAQKARWTPEKSEAYGNSIRGRKALWKAKKQTPEEVEKRMKGLRKPLVQLTLDGNLVKKWPSAKDAEKEQQFSSDLISLVCRGKKPSYKNFLWQYVSK